MVLLGSIPLRRPLVGVIAEFLAPSHSARCPPTGCPACAAGSPRPGAVLNRRELPARGRARPRPERPWREDPRLVRAYRWLTVLWGVTFLLRVLVQGVLYQANDVSLLGTDVGSCWGCR